MKDWKFERFKPTSAPWDQIPPDKLKVWKARKTRVSEAIAQNQNALWALAFSVGDDGRAFMALQEGKVKYPSWLNQKVLYDKLIYYASDNGRESREKRMSVGSVFEENPDRDMLENLHRKNYQLWKEGRNDPNMDKDSIVFLCFLQHFFNPAQNYNSATNDRTYFEPTYSVNDALSLMLKDPELQAAIKKAKVAPQQILRDGNRAEPTRPNPNPCGPCTPCFELCFNGLFWV